MSYILRYECPAEDVDCPSLNCVRSELRENVTGASQDTDGVLRELLERGQFQYEGSLIQLYAKCGTPGVGGTNGR